jgi:membrane associated rhomboid family serine protease
MGLSDRDYYRSGPTPGAFGAMRRWSVTNWLIAINVAVFIIDNVLNGKLTLLGYFSETTAIDNLEIWRFITFQFLHAGLEHIAFNMISLYFFGPIIEDYLGSRRYLAFYLLCGTAGAVSYLLLLMIHLIGNPDAALVGASAGIFGILIASTRVAPNATVMLMLLPIPMKLKTMAWVMVGIAVYTVMAHGHNAGGEAAHLGGAALGYVLIRWPQSLSVFAGWPSNKRGRRPPGNGR